MLEPQMNVAIATFFTNNSFILAACFASIFKVAFAQIFPCRPEDYNG
jgi:hypothetical protein